MSRVSVIIPTYKRNDYILRTIESVINQDYPDVEIVVVDDNGRNSENQLLTEEILSEYINNKQIMYICNEENVGGALARNNGIMQCTGEFVTFLDDDDVYLPGKISIQVKYMVEHTLDLCVMDGETYNREGKMLSHKTQPFDTGMKQQDILKAHIVKHITGTNVFMYRKEALLKIGMFDQISAGQEFMLMQKSITNDLRIGCIHEVYVHFHMDGQERISTRLSKIEGLNLVFEEKKKYFNLLGKDETKYIKSKHHGTLFYMYYINKKYMCAGKELILAFLSSPKYTWETYKERRGKLKSK